MRYILSIITISTVVLANDMDIVASNGCRFKTIDSDTIAKLFMKKTKQYLDIEVTILDNKKYYDKFIKLYLHKSSTKLKIYWTRMIFTGTQKPPKQIEDEQLKDLSNTNTCYISYTYDTNINGWKVLDVTQ